MEHSIDWQPSASIDALKKRAQCFSKVREFFNARGYLEVETPVLGQYGVTDLYLTNITACVHGKTRYLQTSPEYHMKRLLASGSGPIFQLARVFRDDELGRWHNPEFTLLEWYQIDIDHHQLMDEIDLLLHMVLGVQPMIRKTYQQVFLDKCALDPFATNITELKLALTRFKLNNVLPDAETDLDQYLFLLMSHVIEPSLQNYSSPVAVYDWPVSQASLARIQDNAASRFEVYYGGVELANGFHELTDPALQDQRFMQEADKRKSNNLPEMLPDPAFIQALQHGLPACSGVALGLDRLLAVASGYTCIARCMAFDYARA